MNENFDLTVQLDRLADGELPAEDYRALLAALDVEPNGWRRCALALLEAQAFCVRAVEALGNHEEFWDTKFNNLATRFPHSHELPFEVELLEGLDANSHAAILTTQEPVVLCRNHTMMSEQLNPGRAVGLPILLLD